MVHVSGAAVSVHRQQQPTGCLPLASAEPEAGAIAACLGCHRTAGCDLKPGHNASTSGWIVATAVAGSSEDVVSTFSVRCTPFGAAAGLLDHMRQLVGDQPLAVRRRRRVFGGAEYDVAANRVGAGLHRVRSRGRRPIGVHAYMAEVVAEARLEERARGLGQWRAAAGGRASAGASDPAAVRHRPTRCAGSSLPRLRTRNTCVAGARSAPERFPLRCSARASALAPLS